MLVTLCRLADRASRHAPLKERRTEKLIGKTGRSLVRRRSTTPLRHAIAEAGEAEEDLGGRSDVIIPACQPLHKSLWNEGAGRKNFPVTFDASVLSHVARGGGVGRTTLTTSEKGGPISFVTSLPSLSFSP